jgi:hypothetical protein
MVITFEWRVVKCVCKSMHQTNLCLEEIKLHVQELLIILVLRVIIIGRGGDLQDHLMSSTRIFTLTIFFFFFFFFSLNVGACVRHITQGRPWSEPH